MTKYECEKCNITGVPFITCPNRNCEYKEVDILKNMQLPTETGVPIYRIAVFGNERDFDMMNFHPKRNFILIRDEKSIIGNNFSGVIELYNWWDGHASQRTIAYYALKDRQPEIFKE